MSSASPHVLALDVGLSSVKAGVLDPAGRPAGLAERSNTAVNCAGKRCAVDPGGLWELACACCREALGQVNHVEIQAVGVTGHGNGLYGLGSGEAWGIGSMDGRAEWVVAGWHADGRGERLAEIVGGHVWPGQPLAILAELPPLPAGERLLLAKDFIRYRLTGEAWTDPGDATAAGLMTLGEDVWATEAFEIAGLAGLERFLPQVAAWAGCPAGAVTAEAASETSLPAGVPVAAGSIDLAMGFLGDDVTEPCTLHVTAGTWAIHQQFSSTPQPPENRTQTIRSPWPEGWLMVESSPSSAVNLRVLADRPGGGDFAAWEQVLQSRPDRPQGPLFMPYPHGAWDLPGQAGGFAEDPAPGDQAGRIRAVFEGIVLGHVRQIRKFTGVRRLVVTGGLTRSEAFVQMLSDYAQLPVAVSPQPHAALRGAAWGAWQTVGGDAFGRRERNWLQPRGDDKALQQRYAMFLETLEQRKGQADGP